MPIRTDITAAAVNSFARRSSGSSKTSRLARALKAWNGTSGAILRQTVRRRSIAAVGGVSAKRTPAMGPATGPEVKRYSLGRLTSRGEAKRSAETTPITA